MSTERLKILRRSKGYTCQTMADKLGITKSTYNKKENGKMTISLRDAQRISKILERGIDDIFNSDNDNKEND